MDKTLLDKAEHFVKELYATKISKDYCYHSITHTTEVVETCLEIGTAIGLRKNNLTLLLLAAWFHDAGYAKQYEYNEPIGADIAKDFMIKEGLSKKDIRTVEKAILVTDLRFEPNNLLQQAIRDADLGHLGRKDFFERNEMLRKEWGTVMENPYTKADWDDMTISFLQLHRFYTTYAIEHFEPIKAQHLEELFRKSGL